MRPVLLMSLLLLTATGAAPAAATEIVFGAHGGYGAYTQEDLNEIIALINARAREEAIGEVAGGFEYGGHFGARINETTILGVSYGRLNAATSGTGDGESLDVSVPADCWTAFVNWLPDTDRVGRLGLGADAGFVTVSGRSTYRRPADDVDETEQFEGSGLFLAVYVVGDAAMGSRVSLLVHGGFRLAQVPDIAIDGAASSSDLDYSGVFLRAGLRITP